jgi:hypothetical protein
MTTLTPTELDNDPLERRLSALEITTPEFQAEKTPSPQRAVFAVAQRRRRASRGRFVLVLALALIGVAAVYPISEEALRWVGLRPSQVQPLSGSASYGAARMTVAGGYTDDINTVLFIGFENMGCPPFLTDQFGERYDVEGGAGEGVGPYPAIFDPLRGQAATDGTVVSVHCLVGSHDVAVRLTGKLMPHSAHTVETPRDLVIDGTTYQVIGLRWSGTYLEVHTRMSGMLIDELIAQVDAITPRPGQPLPSPTIVGVSFPAVFLARESGSAEIPVAVLNGRDVQGELEAHHVLDEVRVFRANHAGTYRIVITRGEPDGTPIASWTVSVR